MLNFYAKQESGTTDKTISFAFCLAAGISSKVSQDRRLQVHPGATEGEQTAITSFILRVRAGSMASSPHSTGPLTQSSLIKPPDWGTRPSKVMMIIYRTHGHTRGCKHSVPKGATQGKPLHHGANQLKLAQSLESVQMHKLDTTGEL